MLRRDDETPLPESVEMIAEVIGRERALYLVGKLPRYRPPSRGCEQVIVYVPARLKPAHRLVQILGWTDAERIARVFGGEILKPANCQSVYREHRDNGIAEAHEAGIPIAMIADWFDVCARTIDLVIKARTNAEQGTDARVNTQQNTGRKRTNHKGGGS